MKVKKLNGKCEDCGFFNDCPEDYKCPPLEILEDILLNEGIYISNGDGQVLTVREEKEEDE